MKVKELIAALQKFDGDMEVTISDGFMIHYYRGDFEVGLLDEDALDEGESPMVEIAIGGTEINRYKYSRAQ